MCRRLKIKTTRLSTAFVAHPDVALAGEEPLGDASGVQAGAGDVERRHEQQPAHLTHGGGFNQTLADDEVQGRNHAAQTQTHKHAWAQEAERDRSQIQTRVNVSSSL